MINHVAQPEDTKPVVSLTQFRTDNSPAKPMRSLRTMASGWVLLVLGVVGLFLPLLPGIVLLIAGLVVLSREYEWARRLLRYGRERFPLVAANVQQFWRPSGIMCGRGCSSGCRCKGL